MPPDDRSVKRSTKGIQPELLVATVIGGGGTLVGPVLGSLILVPASELLREFGTLRIVFYALILVGFIIFRSEGIMVFGRRKYQQFERWVKV